MDKFDRIFDLHKILSGRRTAIPRAELCHALECSPATLGRIVAKLRDDLGAPLIHDREQGGYRYDGGKDLFDLPGLWFSAAELHALVVMQELLARVEPGLLETELAPLRTRIGRLLADERIAGGELARRVRILGIGHRRPPPRAFRLVADALLRRRRLQLGYHSRSRDRVTRREVSPQRLIHYRDNWYLDAWCHASDGLRTFALDRIRECRASVDAALEIPDEQLDGVLASAYGIFAGEAARTAVLWFTPQRARWVAEEEWHPHQQGRFLDDGRYELRIPYGDPTELVMDILRYGPDVEVAAPATLRRTVARRLAEAAGRYTGEEAS